MLFTIRIKSVENLEIIVHKDFMGSILDILNSSQEVEAYQVSNADGIFTNYFMFGFINIPSKWKQEKRGQLTLTEKHS